MIDFGINMFLRVKHIFIVKIHLFYMSFFKDEQHQYRKYKMNENELTNERTTGITSAFFVANLLFPILHCLSILTLVPD